MNTDCVQDFLKQFHKKKEPKKEPRTAGLTKASRAWEYRSLAGRGCTPRKIAKALDVPYREVNYAIREKKSLLFKRWDEKERQWKERSYQQITDGTFIPMPEEIEAMKNVVLLVRRLTKDGILIGTQVDTNQGKDWINILKFRGKPIDGCPGIGSCTIRRGASMDVYSVCPTLQGSVHWFGMAEDLGAAKSMVHWLCKTCGEKPPEYANNTFKRSKTFRKVAHIAEQTQRGEE